MEKFDPASEQFDLLRHNVVFQIPDLSKPFDTVDVVLKTANQMQPGSFNFSNGSKQFYRGAHESESKENDLIAYVNSEFREMAILGALKRSSFAVEDSPSSTDITGLLSFA